ncbi:hypothetical protein PGT21_023475 [Puccinia graminis f. sp. tritici]|uniref:AB hydrolase-1 domain-containing protein n=2 Tax=Puccinia graminis f. sp. tritici TaxID=56615 RepID=A0A5B0R1C8_PUCGR|nr:hypothetical protein PGT21_023475 [Puccinia graminis f. sp. tritici]
MAVSCFQLPAWFCISLIWLIRSIVPLAWFYFVSSLLCYLLPDQYYSLLNYPHGHHQNKQQLQDNQPRFWSSLCLFFSTIEVAFSIYYLYSAHLVQRRVAQFEHPTSFIRTTINRIVGSGLRPDHASTCSSNSTNSASGSPDSADRLENETLLTIPQISPSRPSSPSGLAPDTSLSYDDPAAIDFRSNQVLWFQNCRWDEIQKENMLEWLAWSLFSMPLEEVRLEDQQMELKAEPRSKLLEEILIRFENRAGARLKPGYNPNLAKRVIRLTLDPISIEVRPLGLYLLSNMGSLILKHFLRKAGFKEAQCTHRCPQGLKYLIRKPPGWDDQPVESRPVPLIFAHGLGIGFCQYVAFLNYMANASWALNKPIVILLQPSISQEVFSAQHLRPPTKETLAADVIQLIYTENLAEVGVELIGHSMGTIVIAWVVKALSNKGMIKRICLIDPAYGKVLSFLACYVGSGLISSFIASFTGSHTFLYSTPRTGIERMIRYFVATELGVAHHLHRYFEWRSNILWPFEIPGFTDPKRFQVFLSEKDSILDPARVKKYLIDNGMKESVGIFTAKGAAHGESVIEMGSHFDLVKKWLEDRIS